MREDGDEIKKTKETKNYQKKSEFINDDSSS